MESTGVITSSSFSFDLVQPPSTLIPNFNNNHDDDHQKMIFTCNNNHDQLFIQNPFTSSLTHNILSDDSNAKSSCLGLISSPLPQNDLPILDNIDWISLFASSNDQHSSLEPSSISVGSSTSPAPTNNNNNNNSYCQPAREDEDHINKNNAAGFNKGIKSSSVLACSSNSMKKKVMPPRFAFHTKSSEDVLDDGYKWRKYGQKSVKNSTHPRYLTILLIINYNYNYTYIFGNIT